VLQGQAPGEAPTWQREPGWEQVWGGWKEPSLAGAACTAFGEVRR